MITPLYLITRCHYCSWWQLWNTYKIHPYYKWHINREKTQCSSNNWTDEQMGSASRHDKTSERCGHYPSISPTLRYADKVVDSSPIKNCAGHCTGEIFTYLDTSSHLTSDHIFTVGRVLLYWWDFLHILTHQATILNGHILTVGRMLLYWWEFFFTYFDTSSHLTSDHIPTVGRMLLYWWDFLHILTHQATIQVIIFLQWARCCCTGEIFYIFWHIKSPYLVVIFLQWAGCCCIGEIWACVILYLLCRLVDSNFGQRSCYFGEIWACVIL